MKKKILIYFYSDKEIRAYYFSNLKKKIENIYNVYYYILPNSRFKNLIDKKKIIFIKDSITFINFINFPIYTILFLAFKILDFLFLKNLNVKSISFRFNLINKLGLAHEVVNKNKLKFDVDEEERSGNYIKKIHGFPFSKNKFFFNLLIKVYFSKYFLNPSILIVLKKKFDLIILTHLQNFMSYEFEKICLHKNIKLLKHIYGWDQPSLKGYIPNFCNSDFIVTNFQLKEDLIKFHKIKMNKVFNLGNYFFENAKLIKRIKKNRFTVLYSMTSQRVNPHEISYISNIYTFFQKNFKNFRLILRPHPNEDKLRKVVREKFKDKHILFNNSTFFDIKSLRNNILKSNLVINSASSVFLDSLALKTDVVGINLGKNSLFNKAYFRYIKKSKLIYYDLERLKKDINSKLIKKKNNILKPFYLNPEKNISNNYIKFINDTIYNKI
jgi:hypothetical protein